MCSGWLRVCDIYFETNEVLGKRLTSDVAGYQINIAQNLFLSIQFYFLKEKYPYLFSIFFNIIN